jgi:hypothetical protein
MACRLDAVRPVALGLTVLALIAAAPAAGQAAWLGFRNDTKMPVVVQGATVLPRNIVRRGAPHLLYAGDVAWDPILQPGPKVITVYDANNPKRVLYQGTIVCGALDLFFSLQIDPPPPPPPPPKGQRPPPPPPPRVKLVPAKPPNPPPGMRR